MSEQPATRPPQTLSDSQLASPTAPLPVTVDAPAVSAAPPTLHPADWKDTAAPTDYLGRFEIHGEIGRGGMGAVFRGRDPALGRDLALKVLLAGRHDNPELVRRFHDEARIGGQLQHPGLVPVYELGADDAGRPFFAMKLVDGRTLASLLKERKTPADDLPRFLTIFEQMCQALAYAHARGVIHRDLKPANIMVGAFGEVQVMDWGLAKVLSSCREASASAITAIAEVARLNVTASDSESRDGMVMGTPSYMPPEQARGEIDQLDARADVFGLGAILCDVLTGAPPFTGRNASDILGQSARGDLTKAFARLDGCGADVELVGLAKACLAAERDNRPGDGAAVAARVAAYRAGVEERLRRSELERAAAEARTVEERRRRRAQLGLAAAVLLLLTLGGGGGWYLRQQSLERQAEQARQETERVRREAERTRTVEDDLTRLAQAQQKRDWNEAWKILERIEGRMEQGGSDELKQRVQAVRDDLERERKNQEMVARLEEAQLQAAAPGRDDSDREGSRTLYENAFLWYGMDALRAHPETLAAQIETSGIRENLLRGLDEWSSRSKPKQRIQLLELANRVDALVWRRALRTAMIAKIALEPGDVERLGQLAAETNLAELTPANIVLLAYALMEISPQNRLDVLRQGCRLHPDDFWLNFHLACALDSISPDGSAEAVRYAIAAQALRPDSAIVRYNLGLLLRNLKELPDAEAAFRAAIQLKSDYYKAYNNLGTTLADQGKLPEAIDAYRAALRIKPDYALALTGLGNALEKQGKTTEAIAPLTEAIKTNPNVAHSHYSLGVSLFKRGKYTEAIDAYREAIRLAPNEPDFHYNLGAVLATLNRFPEAVLEYQATIRLDPRAFDAHRDLGKVFESLGKLPDAIVAYREAVRLKPGDADSLVTLGLVLNRQGLMTEAVDALQEALRYQPDHFKIHYNLGTILDAQGKLAEAEEAYRRAIRSKSDYPQAHCNLGYVLRRQGRFEAGLEEYRRGHELGGKTPGWRFPSARWVQEAERYVELDRLLPDVLAGKVKPANAAEQIEYAEICAWKRRHADAIRFYVDAFQAEANLAVAHRVAAAQSAACAAAGKDEGDKPIDEAERSRLNKLALGWLRDDLAAWGKRLDDGKPADRMVVERKIRQWQQDTALAVVRNADALVKLPEANRADWQKFWQDVEALRQRATGPK